MSKLYFAVHSFRQICKNFVNEVVCACIWPCEKHEKHCFPNLSLNLKFLLILLSDFDECLCSSVLFWAVFLKEADVGTRNLQEVQDFLHKMLKFKKKSGRGRGTCFCDTGLYFINNFSMADTVSYGSAECVFRASFDKSTTSTWGQECWTLGCWERDCFFSFAIMVQILVHPYVKFHWKWRAKAMLSGLKLIWGGIFFLIMENFYGISQAFFLGSFWLCIW